MMHYFLEEVKEKFFNDEWYGPYDLIEFLINTELWGWNRKGFIADVNKVLEEERSPYRIIGNIVAPLISKEEIKEIERVLKANDKYNPVKINLKNALKQFSKRPDPDYANSIKESISAVEALARISLNNSKGSLGDLTNQLNIHPVLKESIKKLYGWTSDESGVRHSEKESPSLSANEEEARFMLVICSAFINYIISKSED